MTTQFDVIVLGLGPGGEDVAQSVAKAGRSVLGVDSHLVGGECPYYGCIPSKMMLRGAEVLAEGRRIPALAGTSTVTPDFAPVHARIRDEATDDWDDRVAVERIEGAGVTFVRGAGRLAGRSAGRDGDGGVLVRVGGTTYSGTRIVIATGTAPAIPPVPGLAELRASGEGPDGPVWTNREAVKAERAPASLIVLGGGAIGCELGQAFARFGTKVTVVESAPRLLGPEEPDAAAVVAEVFDREGITVHTGVGASRVSDGGDGVRVSLEDGTELTAAKILVAAGRRPNLGDIGLETVELDPKARSLAVDEHMQVLTDGAAVPGIYAIGDIAGHGAFTHLAVWQSRVLTAHLLGADEPYGGYHGLAWVTFTDPEVGRVGMTEQQAREAGLEVRTGVAQIASNSRGWIHGPGNDGFVKLVQDEGAGVLVGATVVAPGGGEILGLLTLAVHARVPVRTMATMHYAFPTMHRAVLEALRAMQ
jgi:pyruvate/2-oxoglutarate dehydrogenase complex dihydrolipoamide dehydrogenase (E3) component